MHSRAMIRRPDYGQQYEKWPTMLRPKPTRPPPRGREPEVDFRMFELECQVRRGLSACGELSDVVLLVYGWDTAPDRALFGACGNAAHLTTAAQDEFARARERSHRRQRSVSDYLRALRFSYRQGEPGAEMQVTRIGRACELLTDRAERLFLLGVRPRGESHV